MRKIVLSMAVAAAFAQAQDAPKPVEFEVAAVRVAAQDGDQGIDIDNGQFRTHNLTLRRLAAYAYEVDIAAVSGGPRWADSDSFDIVAKIPDELVHRQGASLPAMVKSLLADRFHLEVHRETREMAGFALVTAKNGPRMARTKATDGGSHSNGTNTHLTVQNMTMTKFAERLSRTRDIGKPVVDRTGLTGGFDFELDWMPEPRGASSVPADDDRPSIYTALEERLGLKLEATKVPVQTVIVDAADKPGEN